MDNQKELTIEEKYNNLKAAVRELLTRMLIKGESLDGWDCADIRNRHNVARNDFSV